MTVAENPHTELPGAPLPGGLPHDDATPPEARPTAKTSGPSGGGGRKRSRGLRIAKWLLLILLFPVALALLVVGLVWGGLHYGPVQRKAAQLASEQLAKLFNGQLKFASVEVSGALRVCLTKVSLDDPQTGPVITADRACVSVAALALARHHVNVRGVELVHPVIDIATVPGAVAGTTTTTLSRALAARNAAPKTAEPKAGPMAWFIEVQDLNLSNGSLKLRPAPKEAPSIDLEKIELAHAKARYADSGAAATLALKTQVLTPGDLPAELDLDAVLNGSSSAGKLEVRKLRLVAGGSSITASGDLDLKTRAGKVEIAQLHLTPADLDALLPKKPAAPGAKEAKPQPLLGGDVSGKGQITSDGKRAMVRLSLQAGGGRIELQASATFAPKPEWSVNLEAAGVDPVKLSPGAPKGKVTVKLAADGKGVPTYDEKGVLGDLEGKLHVGPAHLDGMGELSLDLDARIDGRNGLVKAFTAAGLGLRVAAHGRAALEAVDLEVKLDAPNLQIVSRAIGTLTKQPPPAISGSAQLQARVRGRPLRPDAEVHLRAPRFKNGDSVELTDLAIDGQVHGDLRHPKEVKPVGDLILTARKVLAGSIELQSPSMHADLHWPAAGVQLTAGVMGGEFKLNGDAEIDDDKDGLRIPRLTVSYPGNELHLRQAIAVHFRPHDTVIEPFYLEGEHGGLGLAARLGKAKTKTASGSIEGSLQLIKLDLASLPQFVLPPNLNLKGVINGNVTVDGKLPRPTVDAHLDLKGGGLKKVQGVDLTVWVHLFKNRLKAQLDGKGPAGVRLAFKADAPLGSPKDLPLTAPLAGELSFRELDVEAAAALFGTDKIKAAGMKGTVSALGAFEGTLGNPKVTFSVDLSHFNMVMAKATAAQGKPEPPPAEVNQSMAAASKALGAAQAAAGPPPSMAMQVHDADVHVGLWLERDLLAVDAYAAMDGARPLTAWARVPFDAGKALREPGYLAKAMTRPVRGAVTAARVNLKKLGALGLIPEGLEGHVTGSLALDGTPQAPLLSVVASADKLSRGKIVGIGTTVRFDLGKEARLQIGVTGGEDVLARLDVTLGVTGRELVEIQKLRDPKLMAARIENRKLSGELEIPGLFVGRAAQLAGKGRTPADGRLIGKVTFSGTPGAPRIEGDLKLEDVKTQSRELGHAEVHVEGGPEGATVHLGISPPGGGTLLGHATLKADLTARAILEGGIAELRQGELNGRLTARKLDLAFLSGASPYLRKSAGLLEADVEASGLLGSPKTKGKASLRGGTFDIVGQGIFHHVSFDASFTPKEIVLDKLQGQLGPGTFSAVLVAMSRPPPGQAKDEGLDRLEFTGEIHAGDDDSASGLKDDNGKPVPKAPLPIRTAGEERFRVNGEIDLFGNYENGHLVATANIPDAGVLVLSLPSKKLPSLKPGKDVLVVHPGEKPHPPGMEVGELEEEAKARKTATLRVQLALDLGHLYVKAEDFEFPVRSKLNFEYDARRPDRPTADGTITVPNGSFTALGRRFNIENAIITETGGDITDPELEVKARYEKSSTTVFINVSGTAKDPIIDLQSNPAMDQDAIAFFLATGRVQGRATQGGGGVDLQGAASSVVGGLLFGAVRKELAAALPVDVLTVETSGVGVASASIGKYLGDSFFIGYRQRVTPAPNENSSEGRIEYEISRQVTTEATIGDHNSDVSILWTKDF